MKCIFCTVIIDIQNSIAFCFNFHILVKLLEMETSIGIVSSIYLSICIISTALLRYGTNVLSHSTRQRDGLFKIISITCNILFPDDNGVGGGCVGNPLGVNGGVVRNLVSKRKLIAIGTGRIGVPTAERVTETSHFAIGHRSLGHLSGTQELRCVVFAALAVLVKHQPVAFRGVYAKHHITRNGNRGAVFVCSTFCPTRNVATTRIGLPAQKGVVVVLRDIGHIHRIRHRGSWVTTRDQNLL